VCDLFGSFSFRRSESVGRGRGMVDSATLSAIDFALAPIYCCAALVALWLLCWRTGSALCCLDRRPSDKKRPYASLSMYTGAFLFAGLVMRAIWSFVRAFKPTVRRAHTCTRRRPHAYKLPLAVCCAPGSHSLLSLRVCFVSVCV
jgi:hypothetical protein